MIWQGRTGGLHVPPGFTPTERLSDFWFSNHFSFSFKERKGKRQIEEEREWVRKKGECRILPLPILNLFVKHEPMVPSSCRKCVLWLPVKRRWAPVFSAVVPVVFLAMVYPGLVNACHSLLAWNWVWTILETWRWGRPKQCVGGKLC